MGGMSRRLVIRRLRLCCETTASTAVTCAHPKEALTGGQVRIAPWTAGFARAHWCPEVLDALKSCRSWRTHQRTCARRRTTASFCAATSVTRREPHPAVGDGNISELGEVSNG